MNPDTHRSDPTRPFLDVFVSHASEDRAAVVSPLAKALVALGYSVWMSDHEVVLGNSLPLKINEGLRSCRFGVAVLSLPYVQKHWTMKELAALTSREEVEKRDIIIPVLHNIDRTQLAAQLPLWAPTVYVRWDGNPSATAAAIAKAIGPPVTDACPRQASVFGFASSLVRGELQIEPRHNALIETAGRATSAVGDVWKTVQLSNRGLVKGAPESRKRARAIMFAQTLYAPALALHAQTDDLEVAASEYLNTLRRILEAAELVPGVDSASLTGLNEVYSGPVAATFAQFVLAFTDKRVQAVAFPKRHPNLTRVLDQVGEDLGRLSFAFETLVEFCLSELPTKIRQILER